MDSLHNRNNSGYAQVFHTNMLVTFLGITVSGSWILLGKILKTIVYSTKCHLGVSAWLSKQINHNNEQEK